MVTSKILVELNLYNVFSFLYDFYRITGNSIPFQNLGYSRLRDFLQSAPDAIKRTNQQGTMMIEAAPRPDTKYIQGLVKVGWNRIKKMPTVTMDADLLARRLVGIVNGNDQDYWRGSIEEKYKREFLAAFPQPNKPALESKKSSDRRTDL
jgi:hypothetical protein